MSKRHFRACADTAARRLALGFFALFVLLAAAPVFAQDKDKEDDEPTEMVGVEAKRYNLFAPRPEGWVVAPAPIGAIARFIPADQDGKRIRIDVRVSRSIPKAQIQTYLSSFADSLKPIYKAAHPARESIKDTRNGFDQRFTAPRVRNGETEPDYLYVFAFRSGRGIVLVVGASDKASKTDMLEAVNSVVVNMKEL